MLPTAISPSQAEEGSQPDPQQGPSEQKASPQGGTQAVDPATAERQALEKSLAEYSEAATRLAGSAGSPECVWTGRRIASLLWRDDIDTAQRYVALYDRFGCSSEHLKRAFRCVIQQGPLDAKAPDRLAARVHNCWIAPDEPTTESSQATNGSTIKGGTVPN
jgi:hypothetical protein